MENETVKPGSGCRLSRSPRPALAAAGADRREWHPLRRGPQLPRWSRGSRGAAAEMTSAHPPPPRAIGRVRRCRHESGHATPGLQLPALTAAGLVGPRRHRLVDGGTAQSGGLRSGRRGEECPLADAPPPPRDRACAAAVPRQRPCHAAAAHTQRRRGGGTTAAQHSRRTSGEECPSARALLPRPPAVGRARRCRRERGHPTLRPPLPALTAIVVPTQEVCCRRGGRAAAAEPQRQSRGREGGEAPEEWWEGEG